MNFLRSLISKLFGLIFQILDIINLFKKDKQEKQSEQEKKETIEDRKNIEDKIKKKKIDDLNAELDWK